MGKCMDADVGYALTVGLFDEVFWFLSGFNENPKNRRRSGY
jgi:hypothetical protein